MQKTETPDRLITVCSACKCASCWHGEFMCSNALDAGTIELKRSELNLLDAEHPSHYSDIKLLEVTGQ